MVILSLYYPYFAGIPYQGTSGILPGGLPNPYLEWQQTTKFTIGTGLRFFKDRLIFNGTYRLQSVL